MIEAMKEKNLFEGAGAQGRGEGKGLGEHSECSELQRGGGGRLERRWSEP